MAYTHLVGQLIEISKKTAEISTVIESEKQADFNKQLCIDDLNQIIQQLDHIVEHLEKA